jgi:hypothetical protein
MLPEADELAADGIVNYSIAAPSRHVRRHSGWRRLAPAQCVRVIQYLLNWTIGASTRDRRG